MELVPGGDMPEISRAALPHRRNPGASSVRQAAAPKVPVQAGEQGAEGEEGAAAAAADGGNASAAFALLKLVENCSFRWEDRPESRQGSTNRWTEVAVKFAQDARAAQAAALLSVSDYFGTPNDAADFVQRLCHQLELWIHLDLDGDGHVGARAETERQADAKQCAEVRQRFILLLQSLGA